MMIKSTLDDISYFEKLVEGSGFEVRFPVFPLARIIIQNPDISGAYRIIEEDQDQVYTIYGRGFKSVCKSTEELGEYILRWILSI